MIFSQLNHSNTSRIQLVVNSPAILERNVFVPFALNELFRLLLRLRMDKSPDVMHLIKKVSHFKFFHVIRLLINTGIYSLYEGPQFFHTLSIIIISSSLNTYTSFLHLYFHSQSLLVFLKSKVCQIKNRIV